MDEEKPATAETKTFNKCKLGSPRFRNIRSSSLSNVRFAVDLKLLSCRFAFIRAVSPVSPLKAFVSEIISKFSKFLLVANRKTSEASLEQEV